MENKNQLVIRQTNRKDYPVVYNLIETAFKTADHRDGDEQDFAVRLRNSGNYIPALDLVAETNGQVIGHIMFTNTFVTQPDGSIYHTLLVAPLSVLLEYRSQGVGAALMKEGIRIAESMGYQSAFLVGDPNYYQRLGYKRSSLYGINHKELPPEYVMAYEIVSGTLNEITGVVEM